MLLLGILFVKPINPQTFNKYQQNSFEKAVSNWDTSFYWSIAENGYENLNATNYSDRLLKFSFYPGLPFLLLIAGMVQSINSYYLMYLQNIMIFLFLAYALYNYLSIKYSDIHLKNYVFWTYLLFPFAYFFHVPYTESIFMALTFLSLYYLEQNKIYKSNVIGLFLGFFRVTSIIIGFLNLIKFLRNIKPNFSKKHILRVLSFGSFGVCTVFLFTYFYIQYGDFFLFFKSQQISFLRVFHWDFLIRYIKEVLYYKDLQELFNHILLSKIGSFTFYYEHLRRLYLIQLPFILVVTSSMHLYKKKRYYELFFAWLLLIVPTLTSVLSVNRYLLQSFPFLFAFSELCHQNKFLRVLLPVFYVTGFIITMILFSYNFWVG